jgi:hypothetical protein
MLTLQYKAKVKDAASGHEEDFNAKVKNLKQELQLIISMAMDGRGPHQRDASHQKLGCPCWP